MRMLQRLGHCDDDDDDDYYNHQYHLDESHWLVADEMGGAHHHCHCCCCCCCHEDPQPRLYRFFRCGRCYSVTWHPKITLNINYLNKRIRTYQSVVTMVIEQCRTTQTNQQTRESCITGTTVVLFGTVSTSVGLVEQDEEHFRVYPTSHDGVSGSNILLALRTSTVEIVFV